MSISSNYKIHNNSIAKKNAMNQYEIKDIANTYGNNIKESSFDDKHYSPRRRRSRTPRITDGNYAKTEDDENGDKLNVDTMRM